MTEPEKLAKDLTEDNSQPEERVEVDKQEFDPVVEEKQPEERKAGQILLVEDDLPIAKMYATKLEMEGFKVLVAHNGEEGLVKLQENKFDLVLLDLMIPKLGGMEVLAKLRSDRKFSQVPVIILSNLSQEEDIKKAHELGVKDFLIKSNHTPSEVVKIVQGYFGLVRPAEK